MLFFPLVVLCCLGSIVAVKLWFGGLGFFFLAWKPISVADLMRLYVQIGKADNKVLLKDSADVLQDKILLPMHFSWGSWCLLFLPFHSIEPNSIWFLWWGQTSTKGEAKALKLNLTFPGFVYVCTDEKAGQFLNCLYDYVSPSFWMYITEQTSFQLPCYVPDSPSQKLIWYKPRNTLSSLGNALK